MTPDTVVYIQGIIYSRPSVTWGLVRLNISVHILGTPWLTYHVTRDTVISCTCIIVPQILWHVTLLFHIHIPPIYRCTTSRNTVIITWILGISRLSSLQGFSAYHCYTCMYGFSILVIWIPIHITCVIVPCYPRIPVIRLFPVIDIVIPVTGYMICWYAMCGIPHLLFPFPVILFYAINRAQVLLLSLIHIWRCRRSTLCRSRWSPYH